MDWVFQWISQYGYGAIFSMLVLGIVGLPIPDETIMVFCGYLISRGNLSWAPALACAIAGSWCGITLSYVIGRTAGLGVVHRWGRYFHLNEERLALVNAWFARIGHWALFIGYYIAGVRHFTAIVAGISRVRFRTFAAYAWPGGAVWVSIFLSLGYFLGERWQEIAEAVHRWLLWFSLALGAIVLVWWLTRRAKT